MTFASLIVAAGAEHHGNIMLETLPIGILALAIFSVLGLVTVSYRNVANRHAPKAEAYARAHGSDLQVGQGH